MKPNYLSELQSRRKFLRQAGCAALGSIALSKTMRDMHFINAALAQSNISGYKALVCVFLNGGNDANNMIIPTTPSEWQSYATVRTPVLAIPNATSFTTTTPAPAATALRLLNSLGNDYQDVDGHTYGFHPAMTDLQRLFYSGQCAPVLNVGTLAYPMTKAQYFAGTVPKPIQLFSHSDQQAQWQTSISDQPYISGWGGRIGDLLTTPVNVNAGGQISMAVSLAGSNIFEVGNVNAAPQYSLSTGGAVSLSNVSGTRLTAMQSILGTESAFPDLQMSAYANAMNYAINEAAVVTNALGNNSSASWLSNFPTNVTTPNGGSTPGSSLMAQMKMVARLIDIGSRPTSGSPTYNGLGMTRQIFLIEVGGYDTHTSQTQSAVTGNNTNANVIIGQQANLLAELSQTMNAFYNTMSTLGLANSVTAFTISDFARTFPSNGSGSDHGWGSHALVVGGAVNGQKTYGHLPVLTVNGPSDTGTGRWIPTTAVDQYAATLASWFGVDSNKLTTIFPNLGRFASSNVGFV